MMRALLLVILLGLVSAPALEARSPRVNTRRSLPAASRSRAERPDEATPLDTLRFSPTFAADSVIRAAGYDKPLRSTHETLHLTNLTDSLTITAVGLTVEYVDIQGRTLHSRDAEVRTGIPPGETRLGRFRSWDVQQSFYYIGGRRPHTSRVTPYDIRLRPVYIVVEKR